MADDLAALQAQLYDLMTAPEGVARRLGELGRSPRDLERTIRPGPRLSVVERVDIYANMYFHRILDVLRDEYTKLLAVVGDDAFHNLVTDYLLAHRPSHPSLREAGAALPRFVARHPLAGERPWLPELAHLERTQLELYDGPDADVLGLDDLRALPPAELPALILRAIPCHALLRHLYPVAALWKAPSGDPIGEQPETVLVWRKDVTVFHRDVAPDEQPLLALLAEGASFETLCTRLLDAVPERQAAERAFSLLAGWAGEGLLRVCRP